MTNTEAYERTMNRLIAEVWNAKDLNILAEVFTEDATMHHSGPQDCVRLARGFDNCTRCGDYLDCCRALLEVFRETLD